VTAPTAVSAIFGPSEIAITGAKRDEPIATARLVCYWIERIVEARSYPAIARRYDRKNHDTVIRGVRRIQKRLETDALLSRRVAAVLELMGHASPSSLRPCATFAAGVADGRAWDFLPGVRDASDVCAADGCGYRRAAHDLANGRAVA
jgi:hypothetical protein